MTVDDLLVSLHKAFALFDDAAEDSWGPVFRRQLRPHEGKALGEAYIKTLAGFKANGKQVYPIPIDFESHLPKKSQTYKGKGCKLDFEGHARRKLELVERWAKKERWKIERDRGPLVAQRCQDEVMRRAQIIAWRDFEGKNDPEWIVLDDVEVDRCEAALVSSERNFIYGPRSMQAPDAYEWLEQTAYCRDLILQGFRPSEEVERRRKEASSREITPLAVSHSPASNDSPKRDAPALEHIPSEPAAEQELDW